MPAHEFLTNITFIIAVMGVGALLETAVPMFAAEARKHDRRAANLGLTALTFVSNWLLAWLAAASALALRPTGLMARLGWPAWIEILIGILIHQRMVDEMLRLVHIDGLGDRYPHQLSGGEQQRAAFARALVYRPPLLLLDEPFSSIDLDLRQDMRATLRERRARSVSPQYSLLTIARRRTPSQFAGSP